MADTTLEVLISARDQFTPTANRVIGTLGRMQRAASGVSAGIGRTISGLTRLGLVAGTALVGGLIAAGKAAGDFEAQLRTINTIARANDEDLRRIGEGIRATARDTGAGLEDLTAGYYDLLSAGIKAADAQGVLDAAVRLGIGGLATTSESVDLLTTAINAWGLSASDATHISDVFAKSIEIGKVKADEIAASLANVAPIAAQNAIEFQEVAAAYAVLTAQGTPAAEVTTQMARAIVELIKPKKELEEFQKAVGKSYAAIAGDKGLVVALQMMRDDAERLDVPFQDLFGRVEAYKFALQTTGPQQKLYNDALEAMGDSAGTAAGQFAERQQGLNFQIARLRANILDAAISVGEGLAPSLGKLADRFTAFLQTNREALTTFGQQVGKALDEIDFEALLALAKSAADVFSATIVPALTAAKDAFGALPPEVKGLAAALAGLAVVLQTPVLGSALKDVAGGLGQIGGSLLGAAARGGAARIPGVGGIFAQPVVVTNWPPGLLTGGVTRGGGVAAVPARGGFLGAVSLLGSVVLAGVSIAALGEQIGTFVTGISRNQTDLQAKADAAALQLGQESVTNLRALADTLSRQNVFERLIVQTTGQVQTLTAIENLSQNLLQDQSLGTADINAGLASLEKLQQYANETFGRSATEQSQIGENIDQLRERLLTQQGSLTAALSGIADRPISLTNTVKVTIDGRVVSATILNRDIMSGHLIGDLG